MSFCDNGVIKCSLLCRVVCFLLLTFDLNRVEKTLTLQRQSEHDHFADNACRQCPSKDGRICNLRFADDIALLGGSELELQQLTERLEKTAPDYGMEISSDKSKIFIEAITPTPSTKMRMN